jgi:hypothetical protein
MAILAWASTLVFGCGGEHGRFFQDSALVEISPNGIGTLCCRLVRA